MQILVKKTLAVSISELNKDSYGSNKLGFSLKISNLADFCAELGKLDLNKIFSGMYYSYSSNRDPVLPVEGVKKILSMWELPHKASDKQTGSQPSNGHKRNHAEFSQSVSGVVKNSSSDSDASQAQAAPKRIKVDSGVTPVSPGSDSSDSPDSDSDSPDSPRLIPDKSRRP